EEPNPSSDCATPSAFNWVTPTAPASSTTAVTIQITLGRCCTLRATLGHTPLVGIWCSTVSISGSKCTGLDQNATLPKANKIAGNKVKADSIAKTIPMEAIGPSVLLDFRSLSSNVSRPVITVDPEA